MKALIAILVSLVACTKPNPDLCCSDAADCAAQNLPVDDACGDGLVCRGNQCIAETCSDASDCDAAAPYCVGDACAEQCTMDAQCPGFGGAATDPFCMAGTCVECRDSGDCSGTTPICDANACRGCNANTDCSSGLCNLGTGACVDASTLLYASPGGADTAACTEAAPCSITHAIASVTTSLNTILMAPGTYAATITINSGATMTLLGAGATLDQLLTVTNNSKVTIQDLAISNGLSCRDETTAPDSELDLIRTQLTAPDTDAEFRVVHCHLSLVQTTYRPTSPNNIIPQFEMFEEATITADRSILPDIRMDSVPFTGAATITNSIYESVGAPNSGANNVTISVSFSTSNVPQGCVDTLNGVSEHFSNVIVDTDQVIAASGGDTCFDHVIAYPMMTDTIPAGVTVADPLLKDPANGDFHLTAGSPAIDTGDSSATDPDDFDGVSRPQGAGFDIGAFEYH